MALKKIDLIETICDQTEITMNECIKLVESTIEIIKNELCNGNDVVISGFGKWSVKKKSARMGRNPQTGDSLIIVARKVVMFKASNLLRKSLCE